MRRTGYVIIGLMTVAVVSTVCLAASSHDVAQRGRVYRPGVLEILRGETVRFSNGDEFLHHVFVRSDQFNFDSGQQAPGQIVDVQFTKAGTFEVLCAIHPKMRLVVTVK